MAVRSRLASTAQQQGAAQEIAIAALAFLAAERQRFARFLDLTGIAVDSIRTNAQQPDFLAGVLDHLAADEDLLVAFAAETGVDPADVVAARDALAGPHREGDVP